jgi:photosystem II stability/assembly factor-like uncharacterized protein
MGPRLLVAHFIRGNVSVVSGARGHAMRLPALTVPALALLALALCAVPAHAQFFNAVYSRDAVDVIAAADSGALYRSTSGGVAWTRSFLGSKPLRDVVAWNFSIVVVGDSGKVWRSADLGGTWALAVASGTPSLRRIERLPGGKLIAVGSGGTVLASVDGGATWSPQPSGTSQRINSVRFLDDQNGWIAGANGFLARTSNGGTSWTPVVLGTANNLNCVDARGSAAWVVGDNATTFRSTNGGVNWTQLDLHADAQPDVKAVWVQSADTVFITGGGGFIRRSVDGGSTWSFQSHDLLGQISDLSFTGGMGWAASSQVRTVMRTSNAGGTWLHSGGATITRSWVAKLATSAIVRGSTLAINPLLKSTIYAVLGNLVYRSRDDGDTWAYINTIPVPPTGNGARTNAFVVSPKDTNYWVAVMRSSLSGGVDHPVVTWTDDAGANWHEAYSHMYGEYGIPLEMDPDHPDTMYWGVDSDSLLRSIDRGKTWSKWGQTTFRSPCDLIVVPESDSSVILVSDGITGSGFGNYMRSTGGTGLFTKQFNAASSEIPGMACSRLRNNVTVGTNWSSGGVQRTANYGLTWPNVHNIGQSWGVDIARDDPDVVVFGTYSGTSGYLSTQGGISNSYIPIGGLPGANYGICARDRATILAEQSAGIWKLATTQSMPTTAQTVAVTSPNGGEVWAPGSVHDITWNAANVVLARIQYRRAPGDPWEVVAEVEGYRGHFPWTVPFDASAEARIEVSDAWDALPADSSDLGFTISLPLIAEDPASLGYGSHAVGTENTQVVTVTNAGTSLLVVNSISTGTAVFRVGRTSMLVPVGQSDTVGVTFCPGAAVNYSGALTLTSNGYNVPEWQVPLYGAGMDTVALELASPDGGEQWRYGTGQKIQWSSALVSAVDLAYRTSPGDPWHAIADNVPDAAKSYVWVVPNAPSTSCAVRVRQHGGGMEDVSKSTFSITVPYCLTASALDVGTTAVFAVRGAALTVVNGGTAPLTISSAGTDDTQFWAGRQSLVVPAGQSDTIGVFYKPTAAGYDSATLTVVGDDPFTPHTVKVKGRSVPAVAVEGGEGGTATAFACWQNRPNPFTGRTAIRYALPVAAKVSLEVFNVEGQRVAVLVEEEQGPGEHSVSFGPGARGVHAGLPSGIYFYRFRAGGFSATHRMVMMN